MSESRQMPEAPKRIQLSRAKGWRLPAGAVNVARPTLWGNPFRVDGEGGQAEAVRLYRAWVEDKLRTAPDHVRAELAQLRGHDLACWCKPGTPCHGDVLLGFANAPIKAPT